MGNKEIRLFNVGPAHTRGDVMAYIPSDRIAYTGDILFIGGHPFVWAGPVNNWIAACEKILAWDVDIIVPSHGPITDKGGVRQVKEYLEFIQREARRRYEAGLNYVEAANDIPLEDYKGWTDPERIVANVATLYREFSASKEKPNVPEIFGAMGRHRTKRAGEAI